MLTKSDADRPQILHILGDPFVQKHMQIFVESQGKINLNPNLKQ